MARTVSADAEDFARCFFRLIEERGTGGSWFAARDVLEQVASAHPSHPFVRALADNPGRRVVFSAAAERVRRSEFAHIERKKRGTQRHAPLFYRLSRPMLAPGGASEGTAPEVALPPAPEPPAPRVAGGSFPPGAPDPDPAPPYAIAPNRARAILGNLRRNLEAGAGERDTWRARLLEPLMRIVARLQAVVAGR